MLRNNTIGKPVTDTFQHTNFHQIPMYKMFNR